MGSEMCIRDRNRIGCMDSTARNYSSDVVIDDGSCFYLDSSFDEINQIIIYPQPVKEKLYIQLNESENISQLIVRDINSKIIFESRNIFDIERGILYDRRVLFVQTVCQNLVVPGHNINFHSRVSGTPPRHPALLKSV